METIKTIWDGLDWSVLTDILMYILPALICITLHELAHGLVAYRLGDTTAKEAGRLSLNPIRHMDWMGLLMMVVFHFGWAKPVPVNMYRFKNPKRGMAITALAGPMMNVLITVVFLFLYGLLYGKLDHAGFILRTIAATAYLSISLAIFNLIPISPLDGSKILFSLLPDRQYATLMHYERYGMLLMLALVATGVLGRPLSAACSWVFGKLFIIANWSYGLVT